MIITCFSQTWLSYVLKPILSYDYHMLNIIRIWLTYDYHMNRAPYDYQCLHMCLCCYARYTSHMFYIVTNDKSQTKYKVNIGQQPKLFTTYTCVVYKKPYINLQIIAYIGSPRPDNYENVDRQNDGWMLWFQNSTHYLSVV